MTELDGLIVAAHGRHYLAKSAGKYYLCVTRGKKNDVATGDRVLFKQTSPDQGVIEKILPRTTLLYRSDQYKSKLLAANVSQLLIVVATEPGFSDDLISRSLVAANATGISAHLLLNKTDLEARLPAARERLKLYAGLGYKVHELSARQRPDDTRAVLLPLLTGQSTVLIGQSGMGKSSLVNLMVPDADMAVTEISQRLDSGKHTTTFTRLLELDEKSSVIDSPGFQEFGLYHLSEGMLERAFPEFEAHLGNCRFYSCHHINEPDCALLAAVNTGEIHPTRHELYRQLLHEASQKLH